MQVIYGLENLCRPDRPVAMTIGNFDGVHLGHQAIMRRVVELAKTHNLIPAVMTFEYHPAKILHPDLAPPLLMPMDQRIAIMEKLGIELVLVTRCRKSFFQKDREAFIREVLLKSFDLKFIVEGENFRFGCDRGGDINYLIEVGPTLGFQGVKIESIRVNLPEIGDRPISSSLVRKLISTGKVDLAKHCLGKPYALVGQVISGAQRGRTIGFPTANLNVGGQMLPFFGIYAARMEFDNQLHSAAAVIGPAPTFDQYQPAIEAFLIDYRGDLYGKNVHLHLYKRIRDIVKFESSDTLVAQIKKDVDDVIDILNREGAY
jgi:riboflavin kinase/FMN adenylyltransferase